MEVIEFCRPPPTFTPLPPAQRCQRHKPTPAPGTRPDSSTTERHTGGKKGGADEITRTTADEIIKFQIGFGGQIRVPFKGVGGVEWGGGGVGIGEGTGRGEGVCVCVWGGGGRIVSDVGKRRRADDYVLDE